MYDEEVEVRSLLLITTVFYNLTFPYVSVKPNTMCVVIYTLTYVTLDQLLKNPSPLLYSNVLQAFLKTKQKQ